MGFRTPLKRAIGLGSAKEGANNWWLQRLTGVALVPLAIWLAFSAAVLAGSDYETVRAWIGSPVVAVLLVVLIATTSKHMQLGLQVVVEDYVEPKGLQIAGIILIKFIAVLLALAGIFAVLRIGLGG